MRKRACVAARQAGRGHTPRYTALPPLGPCQGTLARPPPRRSKACPVSTPHTPRVCPTRLTPAAGDGCRARSAPRVAVCAQRALVRPMGHGTLARRLLQLKTAEAGHAARQGRRRQQARGDPSGGPAPRSPPGPCPHPRPRKLGTQWQNRTQKEFSNSPCPILAGAHTENAARARRPGAMHEVSAAAPPKVGRAAPTSRPQK